MVIEFHSWGVECATMRQLWHTRERSKAVTSPDWLIDRLFSSEVSNPQSLLADSMKMKLHTSSGTLHILLNISHFLRLASFNTRTFKTHQSIISGI